MSRRSRQAPHWRGLQRYRYRVVSAGSSAAEGHFPQCRRQSDSSSLSQPSLGPPWATVGRPESSASALHPRRDVRCRNCGSPGCRAGHRGAGNKRQHPVHQLVTRFQILWRRSGQERTGLAEAISQARISGTIAYVSFRPWLPAREREPVPEIRPAQQHVWGCGFNRIRRHSPAGLHC